MSPDANRLAMPSPLSASVPYDSADITTFSTFFLAEKHISPPFFCFSSPFLSFWAAVIFSSWAREQVLPPSPLEALAESNHCTEFSASTARRASLGAKDEALRNSTHRHWQKIRTQTPLQLLLAPSLLSPAKDNRANEKSHIAKCNPLRSSKLFHRC
jgi:hypothetical protein